MNVSRCEARFLAWKISFIRWTDTFGGKEPTTEKPLGIQDLLQAECFPAEAEKNNFVAKWKFCFYNKFAFVVKKKKKRKAFVVSRLTEAPIFQNKHDICLSAFQLIFFVEKTILSQWTPVWHNIGEHTLALIYINTSFINCQYRNNSSCKT